MKRRNLVRLLAITLFSWTGASLASSSLDEPGAVAVDSQGQWLLWDAPGQHTHQLSISSPDGTAHDFRFEAGEAVQVQLPWSDGSYTYELRSLAASRNTRGDDSQAGMRGSAADADANVHSGNFSYLAGDFAFPSDLPEYTAGKSDQPRSTRDQVIADDLIVQGSICAGLDCVNNENFSFDTIRLKANNLRLHFLDTSTAAGFPARSWELTANDTASGGLDYFAITDRGTGQRPFWVRSDAPSHSLMIDPTGRIGMGTSVPAMHLHLLNPDTPGIRLEQLGGGFGQIRWDVAGNEASFFVRDVSSGGAMPLRIQPGSPGHMLTANKGGHVGIGLWGSQTGARLDIHRTRGNEPLLRVRTGDLPGATTTQMELDANGNLYIDGALTQLSSRHAKTNFRSIDGGALLQRVADLPITLWSYLNQPDEVQHMGPTAEDFHAAFGLGTQPTRIAPSDVAGVALAAVQALTNEVAERDRRIESLEVRLQQLEQRFASELAAR